MSDITPYLPRNIVNPPRAAYIDGNILPISLYKIIDDSNHIYDVLHENHILRNKILRFHQSLVRMSTIDAGVRQGRGQAIPWTSNMNTSCITCNEMVDLLNYSVLNFSKYRIIIEISTKI
jgi:hypothetical protein